ncbi:probable glutathione S-transferase parA [Aristolochia californica]|uniref:probable glutathione S-transferase parA n=1 Tax=Aristolochia californica TaxID=171875 RepID=UPI0035D955D0
MANEVSLIDFWASPFAVRARIALAYKGVDYENKQEKFADKSPLLLQMNPVHKKIPVLIHNGRPVCESLIIVQYIDEVWSHKSSLLPTDPYERANARFWADFIDKKVWDYGTKTWTKKGEEQEAAKKELLEILKLLEGELGEKPFFGGENLGYVDVALLPFTAWFYTYETEGNFSVEEECPKLMDWVNWCMDLDCVSKNQPDSLKIYHFAMTAMKKRLGLA